MSVDIALIESADLFAAFSRIRLLEKRVELLDRQAPPSSTVHRILSLSRQLANSLFSDVLDVSKTAALFADSPHMGSHFVMDLNLETYASTALRSRAQIAARRARVVLDSLQIVEDLLKPTQTSATMDGFSRLLFEIEPGARLVHYYVWRYNFNYWELIDQLKTVWNNKEDSVLMTAGEGDIFDSAPSHCLVVSLPMSHKNDPLVHAMVAHEIGHFVSQREKVAETVRREVMADEDVLRQVEEMAQPVSTEEADSVGNAASAVQLHEKIQGMIEAMAEEFAADCCAALLLGFAAPLATESLTFEYTSEDISKDNHPAPSARLRFMFEILKELGLTSALAEVAAEDAAARAVLDRALVYEQTGASVAEAPQDQDDALRTVAQVALMKPASRARMVEMVKRSLPEDAIAKKSDLPSIVELTEAIHREEAPLFCSAGRPSFRQVLNAGWFAHSTLLSGSELFDIAQGRAFVAQVEEINQIVARAIEIRALEDVYAARDTQ